MEMKKRISQELGNKNPAEVCAALYVFSGGEHNSNLTTTRGNLLSVILLRFSSNNEKNNLIPVPTWRHLSPPPTPVCSRGTRGVQLPFANLRVHFPLAKR